MPAADALILPAAAILRRHVARALAPYWGGSDAVERLPIPAVAPPTAWPPELEWIALPDWAADLGGDSGLPIPHGCRSAGAAGWQGVDWFATAFWFLEGLAERGHERCHGPAHSYAFRLEGFPAAMWERAWVNRIALFLRRWAARAEGVGETALFGALPRPRLILTHDVDALEKTAAIRLKQGAFALANAARAAAAGKWRPTLARLLQASRFLFARSDYDHLSRLLAEGGRLGLERRVFVFPGPLAGTGMLARRLIDPGYDPAGAAARALWRQIIEAGTGLGLHPSFDHWSDAAALAEGRRRLEDATGVAPRCVRQHWLRFGWDHTWPAQAAAGFTEDFTLGFNDRPAFRNGAALSFQPWDFRQGRTTSLTAVPTVLMDSHLFDYAQFDSVEQKAALRHWVGEIVAVGGTASLLWHPHTLANDYGWGEGWRDLLAILAAVQP